MAGQPPHQFRGGHEDATVLYDLSTMVMQSYWASATPGLVNVLDIDDTQHATDDPYAALKDGFARFKANITDPATLLSAYHDTVVPPFCMVAARGFFQHF